MPSFEQKYSREEFDKAKKEADFKKHLAENGGDITAEIDLTTGKRVSGEPAIRIHDVLQSNADVAKRKLEKLYTKGEAEALAVNEEYDRFQAQAQEAIKALENFEREKLGMHNEWKEWPDASSSETKEE